MYVGFFVTLSKKLSSRKKKLDVHVKFYFDFFACFYISKNYIMVSVRQVENIQEDLIESRSLSWDRIARDHMAVTYFSFLSTCFFSFNHLSICLKDIYPALPNT